MDYSDLRHELISVCRQLHARNLIASADGNVSAMAPDGKLLITPSGRNKAFLQPEELVVLGADGKSSQGNPSSELLMHQEIYKRCPAAKAVVHAHPPTAIAWTIAHPELTELPVEFMSELILAVGAVPVVPFARPGTIEMAENLAGSLPHRRTMILARHGALAWGETLAEAYNGLERIEHSAQILLSAVTLAGGLSKLKPLGTEELKWLREKRRELGERTV